MQKIIELTRLVERLTIKIANTTDLLNKYSYTADLFIAREELQHEIRKYERN